MKPLDIAVPIWFSLNSLDLFLIKHFENFDIELYHCFLLFILFPNIKRFINLFFFLERFITHVTLSLLNKTQNATWGFFFHTNLFFLSALKVYSMNDVDIHS